MACLKGASKLSTLEHFTDRDEIVKMCALERGGVCLSEENMTVKYHVHDTYNATCNHDIGMGDSMFVYSLGKHGRSILAKRMGSRCYWGFSQWHLWSSECDKISSLQVFLPTKNLHIKSFTLISSRLYLYVKSKIYISSLLHCYQ